MKRVVVACLFASFAGGFVAVFVMQSAERIAFSQVTPPPAPTPSVAPPRVDPNAPRELPSASRLLAPTANGSPAFGHYKAAEDGSGHVPWALQVLELSAGRVVHVHHFLDTRLFARFGLPDRL